MENWKIVKFNPKLAKYCNNKSISNPNNDIKNIEQNLAHKSNKKFKLFKVETFEEYYSYEEDKAPKSGRWTLEEHIKFLQALDKFGIKWQKFRKLIKTRTTNQIRSHCQKFFKKLKNCKDEELGIDFTSDNIQNIRGAINHIKSVNKNFDVVNVLLYMSGKYSSNINFNSRKLNIIEKAVDVNNIFEQDIKSNTNEEINFKDIFDINQVNKSFEETKNKQKLLNNNFENNNNSFIQNTNFLYNNLYNLMNNYINNAMLMNFVNNINNNIIIGSNTQNLNIFYLNNDNQKNSVNNNISENNSLIKKNNINDSLDIDHV